VKASEPFLGEALVYMKLRSPRPRDRYDVLELIRAGLDTAACERWLSAHAADLLEKFRASVAEAWRDE